MKKSIFYYFLLFFIFLVSNRIHAININKENNLNEFSNLSLTIKKQDYKFLEGNYTLFIDGKTYTMRITVKYNKPKANIKLKNKKVLSKFSLKNNIITITIRENTSYKKLIGKILNKAGAMEGVTYDNDGNKSNWSAAKLITESRSKNKASKKTN